MLLISLRAALLYTCVCFAQAPKRSTTRKCNTGSEKKVLHLVHSRVDLVLIICIKVLRVDDMLTE